MNTAYADPILLSTHADQSLLYRDCAALRTLRLMQAWAANHLVEPGRGIVWVARDWLRTHIGVGRSQYFRVLARLRSAGWIEPSTVADETGRERPGFRVALQSADGFATAMRPRCDSDATQMRPRCDLPTTKLNGDNMNEDKAAMTGEDPRQSTLPGAEFETPAPEKTAGKMGKPRRDPRLREVAARVDEYERARYIQHPRCVRPKRDSPEAHSISIEAITRALERVLASSPCITLERLEHLFRAVVELNWEAADRKSETWDWWTGSAMWAPNSLERVLGWLEEQRNWIYLERAAGRSPLPSRPDDTGLMPGDVGDLSPEDQQRAYDQAHGVDEPPWTIKTAEQVLADVPAMLADEKRRFNEREGIVTGVDPAVPGGDETGIVYRDGRTEDDLREVHRQAYDAIRISIGGHEIKGFAAGQLLEIPADGQHPEPSWSRWSKPGTIELDILPIIDVDPVPTPSELEAMEQLSAAVERGDAPGLAELADGLMDVMPSRKTDDELRQIGERKTAYMRSTTPEERAADAEAGRKPWEVG